MNALIVLLGCLAAALAVPANFPHGRTVVYKYTGDVKAGVLKPVPFASRFGFDCRILITHDTSDPTLKNAYHVRLTDVKHSLYNGYEQSREHLDGLLPPHPAAKTLQDPFMIVYNENGQFQGVKLLANESGWSKNIKQAIASMLQLDLININVQTTVKPHSFTTHENTIHGTCQVEYNVQPKQQALSSNVFVVTKFHEPQNCSHFVQHVFNHANSEECHVQHEEPMTTSSTGYFEIEQQGEEVLIRKLVSLGVINYFPWLASAEAHYLLTNQTLILDEVLPVAQTVPLVDFQNVPIVRNVTFNKPQGRYSINGDVDVTQGRHTVNLDAIVSKVKKMLSEAADYLKEDHMEVKQPDWKHGQTINRLLYIMSYMNVDSLEQVYNAIKDTRDSKEVTIRNIFLGVVPKVGTNAACLFTKYLIKNKLVSDLAAITMLSKLPMSVKLPTQELLVEMVELLKFGETVSLEVRKASILCFATLIHQTFKTEQVGAIVQNSLLDRYLWHFMEHVTNEQTYEMKEVYLMAMKNVAVGNIVKLLEPIIRGDLVVSERPYNLRIQAIWAIKNMVMNNPQQAHDLLWPILANVNLPVTLRIVVYDVLMTQLPHMSLMKMYWFMVHETNEHLYNYHVETLKGLANSVDPCLQPVQEMAKKVLAFTRLLHSTVPLSTKYHLEYVDSEFGHGETVKASLILDNLTGMPYVGSVEHTTSFIRKPVNQWGIHWNINGLTEIMKEIKAELLGSAKEDVTSETVRNILLKAAKDMPTQKDFFVDLCLTLNNNVVLVLNYDRNNWQKLFDDVKQWKKHITSPNVNWQSIYYDNMYEMHVPTDLGVPAVLITKTPNLDSLKLNVATLEDKQVLHLKLEFDYRNWKHGENVMLIYNPIADVWHSVRRAMSRDIAIPIEASIGYNHEMMSLKVRLPRLPVSKFSVAGISTHTKSYVAITNDETDILKKCCDNCHHHELVIDTVGTTDTYRKTIDSKDLGLQFTAATYDCEGHVTPILPIREWMKVMSTEHKNIMDRAWQQIVMAIRQQMTNDMISSQHASCSNLIRIAPSIMYPTSHVDLNGKMSVEDVVVPVQDNINFYSSQKINLRGTMDVKAASTSESVRQWDVNVNIDKSLGHLTNTLKAHITRVTKGEKNLKICIDAQKTYPVIESDVLKVVASQQVTNSKMTIMMGQTEEDKCVRDEMDVTVTLLGQMSAEQERHMTHGGTGTCSKQIQNPLFRTHTGYIPRTWECVHDAVLQSTLKNYTLDVVTKKVPPTVVAAANHLQSIVQGVFFPHMTYIWDHVEPGNVKAIVEYEYETPFVDMTVITPTHGYQLVKFPTENPIWTMLMDNTHFSYNTLDKYVHNQTRMCTIYPQVTLNFDKGITPFIVPDQWTLLTGDYVDHAFAVFVKLVQSNKLVLKIHIGKHELEIRPVESREEVIVNGNILENQEKGAVIPADEAESYAMKLTKGKQHFLVQTTRVPLHIFYTTNSVTIFAETELQGQVTGICGHMDGTHKTVLPKIYSVAHL